MVFIEAVVFVSCYKTILLLGAVIKTKIFAYILSLKISSNLNRTALGRALRIDKSEHLLIIDIM